MRTRYTKPFFVSSMGYFGRLMCLKSIRVTAGESLSLAIAGWARISQLRKPIPISPVLDVTVFFTPYRRVIGATTWNAFLLEGKDTSTTIGTRAISTTGGSYLRCTGHGSLSGTVSKLVVDPYDMVWNRYFRNPTDSNGVTVGSLASATAQIREFGYHCCHLPNIWTSGVVSEVTAGDYRISLVDTDKIDLLLLADKKSTLKTERQREFYSKRYPDLMKQVWGSYVNEDTEVSQAPELVFRKRFEFSGQDVNVTTANEAGQVSGKAFLQIGLNIPKKFYAEHGTLQIYVLVRPRPVHVGEVSSLLDKIAEPTYAQLAGDPDIIRNTPPVSLTAAEVFAGSSDTTTLGTIPSHQYHRYEGSVIHGRFADVSGFPYFNNTINSFNSAHYSDDNMFNSFFASLEMAHWQLYASCLAVVDTFIPEVTSSIFAGTK